MTLIPLTVFVSVELALRLTGFGYPTSFLLASRIQGQDYFVPNPEFTVRFFSSTQARPSLPIRIAKNKPAHTYRIFLFGESAANGDPDPTFGMGRYLQVLLRERFPDTDFEILCVAITAINSHTVLPIARECARHEGDLWLIYMGNNEMVGPFGAQTVFGPRAPSVGIVRAMLTLKTTRVWQLVDRIAGQLRRESTSHKSWGGMQMFMENRLRHQDPARLRAHENFERNLSDILGVAQQAGVPVALSTVAVNLRDCAPFASLHAPGLTTAEIDAWTRAYEEGVNLEAADAYQDALTCYQKAATVDPFFADLQFRMGTCNLALNNDAHARRHFQLAADYDALSFRADTTINQSIEAEAARHKNQGVYLVDAAGRLAEQSSAGIPGSEFFYEHVHFNFAGNYRVALEFADQMIQLLPDSIMSNDQGEWASAETCGRRLGVTVWDRQRVWQPVFNRISSPPFTGQLNHTAFFKRCEEALDEARAQMNSQTPEQARQLYEEALALAPEDQLLHGNFEQFLEAGGDLPGATLEAQRVCELAPHLPGPHYYAGTLLVRQGRMSEAEACFARAISIKADYAQAHNELGLILAGQHKLDEAMSAFGRALRADPHLAETYINLGFLQQSLGQQEQALENFLEAAQLQPNGPGDFFHRASVALAQFRREEAIPLLQMIIASNPNAWQARQLLAIQLASLGQAREAGEQLTEVIRLRPDHAPAHFLLGTTLMRLGNSKEAMNEFQTTLTLDPAHPAAQFQMERLSEALENK